MSDRTPVLSAIPRTLLITVWARAVATRGQDPIIEDDFACALLDASPESFTCFENLKSYTASATVLGVAIRTRTFDRAVQDFLRREPDGLVLNVGCGLDARSRRLDTGRATWVDVDVAEVQEWRRELLPDDERHFSIDGSLTEPGEWLDRVPYTPGQAVMLVSEGTLMYFDAEQSAAFVRALLDHFSSIEGFVEVVGDLSDGRVHPLVRAVGSSAPFRGGARDPAAALAKWDPRIEVTSKESLFEHERHRWGIFRWLTGAFPSLHNRLGSVLVGFRTRAVVEA